MLLEMLTKEELEKFFDEPAKEVIKFFIKKALVAQPEPMIEDVPERLQITPGNMNMWIAQALGAGVKNLGLVKMMPVDIIKQDEFVAITKLLSYNINRLGEIAERVSAETTLGIMDLQKNHDYFNEYFIESNIVKEIEGIEEAITDSILKFCERFETSKTVYYIFMLRGHEALHICMARINFNNKDQILVTKSTPQGLFIGNIIDEEFGEVKLYKHRRRLELRLRPKAILENNLAITFDVDRKVMPRNIRQLAIENKLDEYATNLYKTLI